MSALIFIKDIIANIETQLQSEEILLLSKCTLVSHHLEEGEMVHNCYNGYSYFSDCTKSSHYPNCSQQDSKLVLVLRSQFIYKLIVYYNDSKLISYHFIKYLKEKVDNTDPDINFSSIKDDYLDDKDEF